MLVPALLRLSAHCNAHRLAIAQSETRVTHQQLAQRVTALRMALRQQQGSAFMLALLEKGVALMSAGFTTVFAPGLGPIHVF